LISRRPLLQQIGLTTYFYGIPLKSILKMRKEQLDFLTAWLNWWISKQKSKVRWKK